MDVYTFALIAVFAASFKKLIYRCCMTKGTDVWHVGLIYNFIGGLILIAVVPSFEVSSLSYNGVELLALNGILWSLFYIFDLKSYKHITAAEGDMLVTIKLALLTTIGVVIFGEEVSSIAVLGIVLIVLVIGCSSVFRGMSFQRGSVYKVVACIFAIIAVALDKHLLSFVQPEIVAVSGFLSVAITMSIVRPAGFRGIKKTFSENHLALIAATGFGVVNYFCIVHALRDNGLGMVSVLLQAGIIVVFVMEVLLLNERQNLLQRGVCCSACLLGALLVCA